MSTDITGLIQEAWAAKSRGETNDTNAYIREHLSGEELEVFDQATAEMKSSVRSIADALATMYASGRFDGASIPADVRLQAEMIATRHVISPKPLLYMLDELEISPPIVDLFAAMADYGIGTDRIIAAAEALKGGAAS